MLSEILVLFKDSYDKFYQLHGEDTEPCVIRCDSSLTLFYDKSCHVWCAGQCLPFIKKHRTKCIGTLRKQLCKQFTHIIGCPM